MVREIYLSGRKKEFSENRSKKTKVGIFCEMGLRGSHYYLLYKYEKMLGKDRRKNFIEKKEERVSV